MTVDILSSIKGAKPSEAVNKLFDAIKEAHTSDNNSNNSTINAVQIDNLRADEVMPSSEEERAIIKENFPQEKNGFLVVTKVIED